MTLAEQTGCGEEMERRRDDRVSDFSECAACWSFRLKLIRMGLDRAENPRLRVTAASLKDKMPKVETAVPMMGGPTRG